MNTIVVYMANDAKIKGGWADRLHGMISLYKICKMCGLKFKINFTVPFDLSDYLEPRYDWKISADEIAQGVASGVTVSSLATNIALPEYDGTIQYKNVDFDGLCAAIKNLSQEYEYIFCYTNRKYFGLDYELLFNELFALSPKLLSAIDYHRNKINGEYIAVAFRFLTLLGDFEENEAYGRSVLSAELQDCFIKRNLKHLVRIHEMNKGKKILVCSDSEKFKNAVATYDFVYTIAGKPMHIDVLEIDECHVTLTFVDFFMISHSDVVYLVLDGFRYNGAKYEMYNSGFSRLAAQIANTKFILKDYRPFATKIKRYAAGIMRRVRRIGKILKIISIVK